MGLKINCIKEKMAIIEPIPKLEIPSSLLANVGRIGIRIPNPIKSMKIVTKIIPREALFLFAIQIFFLIRCKDKKINAIY